MHLNDAIQIKNAEHNKCSLLKKTANLRTKQCFSPATTLEKEKQDKTEGELSSHPRFETPLPSDRL